LLFLRQILPTRHHSSTKTSSNFWEYFLRAYEEIVVASGSIMFLFFRKVQMTQQRPQETFPDPSEQPADAAGEEIAAAASHDPLVKLQEQHDHKQQETERQQRQKTYRLRMMVLVRILAEVTALAIVALLPVIILCLGKFQLLPLAWKVALCIMSALSLGLIPFYGFITWKVRTDETGLTAVTAFRRKTIAWGDVRSLVKRSTWNFPRYVVEAPTGELSFPVWLDSMDELLERIKTHLPTGSASFNPYRMFKQDPVLLGMHMAQGAGGLLFIGVLWFFFAASLAKGNQSDSIVLLIFCVIASAILLWRTFMILFMPLSVEVKLEFVVIKTCFFQVAVPWHDIVSVAPTIPLLPEGYLIKTKRWSYLIGNGMDRSDELEQALKDKSGAADLNPESR